MSFLRFILVSALTFWTSLGLSFEVQSLEDLLDGRQGPILSCSQSLRNKISQLPSENDRVLEVLHQMASINHTSLGYRMARQVLLGRIYLDTINGEYAIRDVYCLKTYTRRDFNRKRSLGPDQVPDDRVLNTEHTWPQSRFTGLFSREMQKSDLHHLFPADATVNSSRGSYKYGELSGPSEWLKCNASKVANTEGGIRFEPPLEFRGNIARALFYFAVRYKVHLDADEEMVLRKWHLEDPVDQEERARHELIVREQGNRNPFIDHPELVDLVRRF